LEQKLIFKVKLFAKGTSGIVLSIFWLFLVSNQPANHKFISDRERLYIIDKTADITLTQQEKKV
jgi:hypothetical protein